MKYAVELTWRATKDIDGILAYLGHRSKRGVLSWSNRWNQVLQRLGDDPESCLPAPENEDHDVEIRHVVLRRAASTTGRCLFCRSGAWSLRTSADRGKIRCRQTIFAFDFDRPFLVRQNQWQISGAIGHAKPMCLESKPNVEMMQAERTNAFPI